MTEIVVSARLPLAVVERLDRRARSELRSRSNLAAYLIVQGLAESSPVRRDVLEMGPEAEED